MENRRSGTKPISPDDWILAIEISRSIGRSKEVIALSKLALKHHPTNPYLQIYWNRACLLRGHTEESIRFLEENSSEAASKLPELWAAELASNYASANLGKTSLNHLKKSGSPDGNPNLLYLHACTYQNLRQWDEAIHFAKLALEIAPKWQRARAFLCHCQLSRGLVEDAKQLLQDEKSKVLEDALFDITGAMLSFSLGNFEQAEEALKAFIEIWPKNDYTKWAQRTLFVLWHSSGKTELADTLISVWRDVEFPNPLPPDGKHLFLPLTLIAQAPNHCVPTSVAMVMRSQGHADANPEIMFKEMRGNQGTALWRMRKWLNEHGLKTIAVQLNIESVQAILQTGVALIGVTSSLFDSHVEVICGFDERLKIFYLRDPMHWTPGIVPQASIKDRYEQEGCVYAIVDPTNIPALEAAQSAQSETGNTLLDLAEAVASADRDRAEKLFQIISDDSAQALMRDQISLRVVLSPNQYMTRCKSIVESDNISIETRLKALMTLRGEEHHDVFESFLKKEDKSLNRQIKNFVHLMQKMQIGEWNGALLLIDKFLKYSISQGNLWVYKADILAELGDSSGSNKALDRAMELMPRAVWLRERALRQNASHVTWTEYLAELDRLMAEDPTETSVAWGRVLALYDGPNGRTFEKSIQDYLQQFPRDPEGWLLLAQWHSQQKREDLADSTIRKGRELLSEEDLPWRFQEDLDSKNAVDDSTVKELPTSRDELFNLLFQWRDPRWNQVLGKLKELQQQGSLNWHETARLCSGHLLSIDDDGSVATTNLESIFPKNPPGPAHWFTSSVADIVSRFRIHPGTAKALGSWIDHLVPHHRNYQNLWFQRIFLVELEQENERALTLWESYVKCFPQSSSAHYRIGCIKQMQSDFPSATHHYQRALESNPGLMGALENLFTCTQRTGSSDEAFDCLEKLRQKYPYELSRMSASLRHSHHYDSTKMDMLIAEAANEFPEAQIAVINAMAAMLNQDVAQAKEYLEPLGEGMHLDNTSFEEFLKIGFEIYAHEKDFDKSIQLARAGLQRWPDSLPLKEQLAANLTGIGDQQTAHKMFGELLTTPGGNNNQNAFDFLCTSDKPAMFTFKEFIQKQTDTNEREDLALSFASAMAHPNFANNLEKYLLFCREEFPRNKEFSSRLVNFYHLKNSKKAVKLARELHDSDPDHPYWAYMLGRVMLDHKPKKALPYLEQAHKRDRSGDILFDLGRCHQILGNRKKSIQYHWENLKQDPLASASLTALHIQKESAKKLWMYLNPMLSKECGEYDDYFHVSAVFIAKKIDGILPPEWFAGAVRRMEILQTHPGFHDEKQRLRAALRAWKYVRPESQGKKLGIWGRFLARISWPGTKWIPNEDL